MNFSWQISDKSIKQIQKSLENFEIKMKKKIIRQGARAWGKMAIAAVKSNMNWGETDLKKHIKMKVRTLKKNKGVWVGVGVESGVKLGEGGFDSYWAATKLRWYNDGWTPYPKGKKSGRKGKGWRLGLRGQGGNKVYRTQFMQRTAAQVLPQLPSYIIQAINEAIKGTE